MSSSGKAHWKNRPDEIHAIFFRYSILLAAMKAVLRQFRKVQIRN